MQAVLNFSGEGTRLRPLTCDKAAALLPLGDSTVAGKMIEHLKLHGVDDVVIITGYMAEKIKEYLTDGTDWGVKITYVSVVNGDGALKVHSDILSREFLYFSNPVYTDINLTKKIKQHRDKNAYVSLLAGGSASSGIVCDRDGRVTRIEEKRMWSTLGRSGGGIYILNRDIIRFIPEETRVELTENVMPQLVRVGKSIYALASRGVVEAVVDFASYMRANVACLDALKKTCAKGILVEEGAKIEKGALLEGPCYIGKNAHIHKGAKIGAFSYVGQGAVAGSGVSVKRSIIGEGCRLGKNCALRGCVLDEYVQLGCDVNIYEQAVVGANTKIGDMCAVKSFVRIWPEKNVEKGTTVSENIMWGQKKRARLFENGVIEGIVNVDITPRFCTLLGECAGAAMDMGEIGISTDGSPVSAMLRDGIVAGLIGVGAAVKDFGEQPLPITRRGVSFYMLQGAICINVYDKDGEDRAEITVVGKNGLDIDAELRRRMEDFFEKGDFMYPEAKNIKECEYHFEYKLYYLKSLVGYSKKRGSKKILLSCPAPWGRRLIASAMSDFECAVSMYSPAVNEIWEQGHAFKEAVKKGGFDFGFVLDKKCEKLNVVLPDRIIDEDTYEALCSLVVMKKHKAGTIYVPVTATSAIDRSAKKYGWHVVRTKTTPAEIMRHMSGEEKSLLEQFIFRFDAVGAVIKLIDYIIGADTSLEALLEETGAVSMAKTIVEVPEAADSPLARLGRIEGASEQAEGVKITLDKGWVVVVPDIQPDTYRVVSEGVTAEFARELCDFCIDEMLRE